MDACRAVHYMVACGKVDSIVVVRADVIVGKVLASSKVDMCVDCTVFCIIYKENRGSYESDSRSFRVKVCCCCWCRFIP